MFIHEACAVHAQLTQKVGDQIINEIHDVE
jgi:hypothetical protein